MDKQARLRTIIKQVSQKDAPADPEESLFDSGVLDSFALPDFVVALEKEFGVKVPKSDLRPQKFETLAKIEEYLG